MKRHALYFLLQFAAMVCFGQTYHIGDLYTAEDGSQGIVFFVTANGGGWAVALHDAPSDHGYVWTGVGGDIPELTNYDLPSQTTLADTSGYANTLAIRNYSGAGDYAANAVDFDHGWYLPAIGQMTQFYVQLVTMNASLTVVGGTPFDWNEHHYYWSSTEAANGRAWNMVYGGSPRDDYKYATERIRCVRNF